MKKHILVLIVLALIITQFWGCDDNGIFGRVNGSGDIVEVDFDVHGFDRIDVSQAFELSVEASDTFGVVLLVDDNVVEYLEVRRSGDWLVIDLKDNQNYNNVELKAVVHMPQITELRGSGATVISMDGFSDSLDFNVELSGASVFSANLIVDDCELKLSGASVINMNGSCQDLYLESSGASELNMGDFMAVSGRFELSGASNGTVFISDHLDVTLSGASVLRYYGDPVIGNLDVSGASSLIHL